MFGALKRRLRNNFEFVPQSLSVMRSPAACVLLHESESSLLPKESVRTYPTWIGEQISLLQVSVSAPKIQ